MGEDSNSDNVVKYEFVTIPSGLQVLPPFSTEDGYFLRTNVDGGNRSLTWETITIPDVSDFITKDITSQVTITNDTNPQLTIQQSSDSSNPTTLRLQGRRTTNTNANSTAIEFYNYDSDLDTSKLYGRIVTRTEGTPNIGKMRFQVSPDGSTNTNAVLDLTSDRRALFLGDADFANIPTHDGTYNFITTQTTEFNPPEASSSTRGGIKIGYTQSGTTYPVKLSSEKAYVDIDGFNSDLSDYSQTGTISLESTSDGRINLTAKNGIWLKCMDGLGSIGVVNFGRVTNYDLRYNTIENFNTSVAGAPYMSFKVHDGVDDGDDNTQVTPLKLYGDKLISGTHMELVSNIYSDSGGVTPNLLIKPNNNGNDVNLVLQGARNNATTVNNANITFQNKDDNIPKTTQTDQIGILGRITGKVTNNTTNVGDLLFFSSSNGVLMNECMRITSLNNLNITGQLERNTNGYMTVVGEYASLTTNIGGATGVRFIAWNNTFTSQGLTHTSSSAIPAGSLFTRTSAGQGHYRINVVLGCDSLSTSTRHIFALYVYVYGTATSTTVRGSTNKQEYFVGNGYGRAVSGTNKMRVGGNIDIYLNENDQFEIGVDKIYGGTQNATLTSSATKLIIERIH